MRGHRLSTTNHDTMVPLSTGPPFQVCRLHLSNKPFDWMDPMSSSLSSLSVLPSPSILSQLMEFMTISNTYVTIKERIEGAPKESNFEFKTEPLPLSAEPCLNRVIVKCYLVSIDPYILNCMKINCPPSLPDVVSVTPGQPIAAYGVGRVVASGFPEIERDELVVGFLSWGEYCVVEDGSKLRKLDPMGFPLSYHLGVLGLSGLTAYSGFFEVCKPRKGEKVFVSAASGSVGHLVGQFAKLFGCYVVGCAGTKHKVELLKEKLGFDDAFNYKEEFDLKSALRRCFPDGIDIYFDNVGGELLEAAVTNMNSNGRVAACGAIAEYINNRRRAALNLLDVISKRITIQGFLTLDRIDMFSDFISTMSDHLRAGRIQALEDISHGVESIPSSFIQLFSGHNIGKKIVHIADH